MNNWSCSILSISFQFVELKDVLFVKTNGKVINPIDLQQIRNKADGYQSFLEFSTDISWFIHNCCIMNASVKKLMNAVKALKVYVDEEIQSIVDCTQCYSDADEINNGAFVDLCDPVHPLVWAKSNGYSYWPAKVMGTQGNNVRVQYFGDHSNDTLPVGNCYKFCAENPSGPSTNVNALYEKSMKVLSRSILSKIYLEINQFLIKYDHFLRKLMIT